MLWLFSSPKALGENYLCTLYSWIACIKDVGYHQTYSLRVGGKLCILISVRFLPLMRCISENSPPLKPHDLHMFKFILISHCVLQWVKPMGEGALPKCRAELNYLLILGPLFENAATLGLYPTHASFIAKFDSTFFWMIAHLAHHKIVKTSSSNLQHDNKRKLQVE